MLHFDEKTYTTPNNWILFSRSFLKEKFTSSLNESRRLAFYKRELKYACEVKEALLL
jgi:hypothetical protein